VEDRQSNSAASCESSGLLDKKDFGKDELLELCSEISYGRSRPYRELDDLQVQKTSHDFNVQMCLYGFESQRAIQPNYVPHKRKLRVS
jgi:hypothetical protein